ncbi:MAG: ATP-binding protein [Bacillota bacterium]
MKTIKQRLVGTNLIITLVAVAIFEVVVIYSLVQFYYKNVEAELNRSAGTLTYNYVYYLDNYDFDKDARILMDSFSGSTIAQVQIIDRNGLLLADSIDPKSVGYKLDYPDVVEAVSGNKSIWRGQIPLTYEPVMSVSHPVIKNNKVIGIIRIVTSLSGINQILLIRIIVLVVLGTNIILMVFLAGIFLSATIVKPVEEITAAAGEFAKGRFGVRLLKMYDDEVGKLADTMNYMAEEIENHQKLKSDFIASISHELRTPLTSIKGWILTINSGSLENKEELKEGLSIVEKESERLALLVEELLDFSKFTVGQITLITGSVSIKEIISHVGKQMKPRAERQGIELKVDIDEGIPLIDADENRLKQVLINILDNAFKFTPEGGYIFVMAKNMEKEVWIRVEDTGSGIPDEDLPNVTQKFYKGNNSRSGSGLGLSICEEIVRLHNGIIEITSTVGKGTVVNIFLPI